MPRGMTWQEARRWGIEAFRTMWREQVRVGPKEFGNNWPDVPKDWHAYDSKNAPKVRILPSPAQISRMEQFFDAVNLLDDEDRHDIRNFLYHRCAHGRSVVRYCREKGILEHNYRRRISVILMKIAKYATGNGVKVKNSVVETTLKTGNAAASSDGLTGKYSWQSPNQSIPTHMQISPEESRKRLGQHLAKLNEARKRRAAS